MPELRRGKYSSGVWKRAQGMILDAGSTGLETSVMWIVDPLGLRSGHNGSAQTRIIASRVTGC